MSATILIRGTTDWSHEHAMGSTCITLGMFLIALSSGVALRYG